MNTRQLQALVYDLNNEYDRRKRKAFWPNEGTKQQHRVRLTSVISRLAQHDIFRERTHLREKKLVVIREIASQLRDSVASSHWLRRKLINWVVKPGRSVWLRNCILTSSQRVLLEAGNKIRKSIRGNAPRDLAARAEEAHQALEAAIRARIAGQAQVQARAPQQQELDAAARRQAFRAAMAARRAPPQRNFVERLLLEQAAGDRTLTRALVFEKCAFTQEHFFSAVKEGAHCFFADRPASAADLPVEPLMIDHRTNHLFSSLAEVEGYRAQPDHNRNHNRNPFNNAPNLSDHVRPLTAEDIDFQELNYLLNLQRATRLPEVLMTRYNIEVVCHCSPFFLSSERIACFENLPITDRLPAQLDQLMALLGEQKTDRWLHLAPQDRAALAQLLAAVDDSGHVVEEPPAVVDCGNEKSLIEQMLAKEQNKIVAQADQPNITRRLIFDKSIGDFPFFSTFDNEAIRHIVGRRVVSANVVDTGIMFDARTGHLFVDRAQVNAMPNDENPLTRATHLSQHVRLLSAEQVDFNLLNYLLNLQRANAFPRELMTRENIQVVCQCDPYFSQPQRISFFSRLVGELELDALPVNLPQQLLELKQSRSEVELSEMFNGDFSNAVAAIRLARTQEQHALLAQLGVFAATKISIVNVPSYQAHLESIAWIEGGAERGALSAHLVSEKARVDRKVSTYAAGLWHCRARTSQARRQKYETVQVSLADAIERLQPACS